MSNRVCLIIPYFGKLPNYFNLWMLSASYNTNIDFLIFSDNPEPQNLPNNIYWKKTTLDSIRKKASSLVDFTINLEKPYKLCDYRPAYGVIFKDYINSYEWWGFCDLDVILGDLSRYITDEKLDNYEKILELGPLTFMKNTERINNLWKLKSKNCWSYKQAFKYDKSFHFDEGGGLSFIALNNGVRTYSEIPTEMSFADIDPFMNGFRLSYVNKEEYFIFLWKDGKLFGYYFDKDSDVVRKKEYTYLHLQKRRMIFKDEVGDFESKGFIISPNSFSLNHNCNITSSDILQTIYYPGNKNNKKSLINRIKNVHLGCYIRCKIIQKINNIPFLGNEEYFEILKSNKEIE